MKAVIHYDLDGGFTVYADEGVDVYCVDDRCPNDRTYRFSPEEIPDGMIDEKIGHMADGSPEHSRTVRAVREALGDDAFEVIDGGKPH